MIVGILKCAAFGHPHAVSAYTSLHQVQYSSENSIEKFLSERLFYITIAFLFSTKL